MLKNPAYKGEAAFGKTKTGKMLPKIRPQKHSQEQPKKGYSTYPVEKKDWITIPVPAIISEDLFEIVQRQLEENRKMARTRKRGASYLLQGLVVCARCQYAFYGKPVRNKRGEKIDRYAYYRCIGTDAYRFGGNKVCDNKQLRTDTLEIAVWEEVLRLLRNPKHIKEEYQRRLNNLSQSPRDNEQKELEKQSEKICKGMSRLIDSYADGYLTKGEFEPRIKTMKARLKHIEEQRNTIIDQQAQKRDLDRIISNLESFAAQVCSSLSDIGWEEKREIIRMLVKKVEIDLKEVNVVFKVGSPLTPDKVRAKNTQEESLQDCCRGNNRSLRCSNM